MPTEAGTIILTLSFKCFLSVFFAPAATMAVCTIKPPTALTGPLSVMVLSLPSIYSSIQAVSVRRTPTIAASAILSVALPARAEKEIATAGTGNPTLTTGDAPDSICPYGWRLPTDDKEGSLMELTIIYTAITGQRNVQNTPTLYMQHPLGINMSGMKWGEDLYGANYAMYHSSWVTENSRSYILYLLSNSAYQMIFPHDNVPRNFGASIRCLAR